MKKYWGKSVRGGIAFGKMCHYDRGYIDKLRNKLNRYDLPAGYDMSTNAQLLIKKQKLYEKEVVNHKFLLEEESEIEKQFKQIKKLFNKEPYYKNM